MGKEEIANILLEKKAITLNTANPYTFVSGVRSPIYTDNRLLTFYPDARKVISAEFVERVRKYKPEVIAGTASSAIAWAAWVADKLELPMVYVRQQEKDHGKSNLIEGGDIKGKRVVVVEDLVSTGGSSMNVVDACRQQGAEVLAMVAIFTYEFAKARSLFEEKRCKAEFLTDFTSLIRVAAAQSYLGKDKLSMVLEWSKDPSGWGPKHGFPLGEKKC